MGLFDDAGGLLPGLLPCAWRGVRFWAINADHSVGRRIHAQLYPGLDLKTHDDTGPIDGPIRISGLLIGGDYIAQAEALGAAFRAPGPATLIHPWRGPIRCVLLRPARFDYDSTELRVVRLDAEFDPVTVSSPSLPGTLTGALSALGALVGAATGLVGFVLSAAPLALGLYSLGVAATLTAIDVAADWAGRARQAAALLPLIAGARNAFVAATSSSSRFLAAPLLAQVPARLAADLGLAFRPQPASGVAPGAGAVLPAPPDPRIGATLLLTLAADLGRRLRPGETPLEQGLRALAPAELATAGTERAVLAGAEASALAQAARLILNIPFVSRQEAQGWGGRIDEALRRAAVTAASLAEQQAAPAATLWRALNEARARVAMDLSETIGRLPSVQRLEPPARGSAILLAQHLVGDDPAAVFAYADDIVTRNRLRHPAILGGDPVEVLR